MSAIYVLYEYNNYYNRIVKRETSLEDYLDEAKDYAYFNNINFIPNDYIDTMQVLNVPDKVLPNYLLVVDDNQISSRWFIVNVKRHSANQVELTLHRDLIADFYNNLLDESTVAFIEKATLPGNNNLIFNAEDMSFNQIKTSELLLKDQSECPWLVIYGASKTGDGNVSTFDIETETNIPVALSFDSVADFHEWEVYQAYANHQFIVDAVKDLRIVVTGAIGVAGAGTVITYTISENADTQVKYTAWAKGTSMATYKEAYETSYIQNLYQDQIQWMQVNLGNYIPEYDPVIVDEALKYRNGFIRVRTGTSSFKYYTLKMQGATLGPSYTYDVNVPSGLWYDYFQIRVEETMNNAQNGTVSLKYKKHGYTLILEDVTNAVESSSCTISGARYHLIDAPYDMFCIPYSDDIKIINTSVPTFPTVYPQKLLGLNVARALIEKYSGSGQIYDAQILPYCPLSNTVITKSLLNGQVTLDINASNEAFTPIYTTSKDSNGNAVTKMTSVILHGSRSSFSRDIELKEPVVITDYKIESQCDMYRLVSPNYNGVFEFNAAKNDGISTIHIQCTYKPYTPYIKVYPDWGRLYGTYFGEGNFDARGLICGGDFSLPMTTSAWATYELENKNYQTSFDRTIQNMEVNNNVARAKEKWGVAANAVQAFAQGKQLGDSSFLGLGGLVGVGNLTGAAAAAASTAAGLADINYNNQLRNEAIDYTQDMFGYSLQNIQALPQSLSKVTAYNIDNKYFPFLEYYTCSEVEKDALRSKIKYNGMTVMAIGKPIDYIDINSGRDPMYFKCKLIRMESLNEDYHIMNAIANELNQGVFI